MSCRVLSSMRIAFGFLLSIALMSGCAQKVTTGGFPHVNRIEVELKRGVSTKADVQRLLGVPKGLGSSILPTDPRQREVWLYDDVETTDFKGEGGGVLRVNVRQQILLVFFDKEVFDGFMWFTTAGTATSQ